MLKPAKLYLPILDQISAATATDLIRQAQAEALEVARVVRELTPKENGDEVG